MKSKNENRSISLELSEDEAIVLLEWLHNFNEKERPTLFQDQAEERILFDLEAELEKVISGTFADDYKSIITKARDRIRDRE